jgi:translation elongation factor EF-1alpha
MVTLKAIEASNKLIKYAGPGTLCDIALHLPTSFDPNYLKSGNVICDPKYPIHQIKEFRCQIVVFDIETPITRG